MATPVDLSLHLTQAFIDELTQKHSAAQPGDGNGIYAYLWYDQPKSGGSHWTQLVNDGALVGGTANATLGTHDFTVQLTPDSSDGTKQVTAGKIYLIVQSEPITATHVDLETTLTSQSMINPGNALQYHFGYDTFEVTLGNSPNDAGNLSAIDSFSRQLGVSVTGTGGTNARGYSSLVDATALDALIAAAGQKASDPADPTKGVNPVAPYPAGSTAAEWHDGKSTDMIVFTPAQSAQGGTDYEAFKSAQWQQYIDAVLAMTDIEVSGYFNGAADKRGNVATYHNPGYFAYTLTKTELKTSGVYGDAGTYFLLSPEASSQVKGYIVISPEGLRDNLYSPGLGTATAKAYVFSDAALKNPFNIDGTSPNGEMNTGENNQWGKIFTQIFTGFSGGYYGGVGHSIPTALDSATKLADFAVNLNKSYNWDPTYAFDGARSNTALGFQHYDPYAKVFFDNAGVYGGAYSDALTSKFTQSVLLPVYDHAAGRNYATIDLWAYGREEAMGHVPGTSTAFFAGNKIANYLAPNGDDYAAVSMINQNLNISVALANGGMVVDIANVAVKLGLYLGDGTFQYLSIPTGADQKGGGYWQNWRITFDDTKPAGQKFALVTTPTATTEFTKTTTGTLTFNQFPSAANTTVVYELVVGDKTFHLYAKTDASGSFTETAIDGLGTAVFPNVPGPYQTFTAVLLGGEKDAIPPGDLIRDTSQDYLDSIPHNPDPINHNDLIYAPVAGTLSGTSFTALAGQTNWKSITLSLTGAQTLAFAWSGKNPIGVSWISGPTNKIHALDVALVTITDTATNKAVGTLKGIANIDGEWQTTTAYTFAKSGTYKVTITEQTPDGHNYGWASFPLTLDITVSTALFTAPQLGTMTPTDFNLLELGGTHVVDSVEKDVTLTLEQALGLGALILDPADRVTVAATGAELAALTTAQLAALAARGVDFLDATDDALVLDVAQYLALAKLKVKLTAGDQVTLRDGSDAIAALGTAGLKSLGARLVDVLDSTDGELRLPVDALLALGGVTLDPSDTVTATAHGLRLTLLTQAEIAQLGAAGVDAVDSTTRVTGLTNGQLKAFDSAGISLSADDLYLIGAGLGDDVIDVTGQPFGPDDLLSGSTGDDLYRVGTSGAKAIELPFSGQDTVESAASYTLFPFIEALVLVGTDDIDGTGSATASHLTGNAGNNRLTGLGGEDSLAGGDGNDTLIGGRGADELTGGTGADAFRFLSNKDGMDTIHDFTPGEDRIELSLLAFGALGVAGALDPARFAEDAPVGKVAQLVYDTVSGLLTWDADGTGAKAPVLLAQLEGAPSLSAADLALVA
ncbi:calcium-binding protein [Roseomonas sp. AR75]|uniref:calcium-binding protein n=1 Tax=Roseomonas sp. AR75 TaxID=2562311 RepID=UPI0010BFA875|nr:calcium-binding protein [Roseomonas sp. AR75]